MQAAKERNFIMGCDGGLHTIYKYCRSLVLHIMYRPSCGVHFIGVGGDPVECKHYNCFCMHIPSGPW